MCHDPDPVRRREILELALDDWQDTLEGLPLTSTRRAECARRIRAIEDELNGLQEI